MATYTWDKESQKWIPKAEFQARKARKKAGFFYIPDIPSYQCVVTNKVINSRPEREAMMKEHNLVDFREKWTNENPVTRERYERDRDRNRIKF